MEAITASLERSLQNCSLNHNTRKEEEGEGSADAHGADGLGISSTSDDIVVDNHNISNSSDPTLELNSHLSLPYHWEQCLELKTGEIYYINRKNGMKAKEDPRSMMSNTNRINKDYVEESEEEEESWYDSEESSSESCCPSSSSINKEYHQHQNNINNINNNNNVLVVAGCKSCLMYFMVSKQVEDCPKCTGQLLHFDRSLNNNNAPSP
ncbi:unnamed protein product [Lupinus luteus]|uniref:GIR1-like zinc ribbon domain-containing protein n=1 Tax=Lupinus luteus TaxID=3873 RepID=A0AAV1WGR8_LUPLU